VEQLTSGRTAEGPACKAPRPGCMISRAGGREIGRRNRRMTRSRRNENGDEPRDQAAAEQRPAVPAGLMNPLHHDLSRPKRAPVKRRVPWARCRAAPPRKHDFANRSCRSAAAERLIRRSRSRLRPPCPLPWNIPAAGHDQDRALMNLANINANPANRIEANAARPRALGEPSLGGVRWYFPRLCTENRNECSRGCAAKSPFAP